MEDLSKSIELFFMERYKGWEGAEQFRGTSERLVRMVDELCWPLDKIEREARKCLEAEFSNKYDEMVVSGPTSVWTLCPHHLLLCNFRVYIGCIPNGKVLGLSKYSRVAKIMGRRPIMQETYVRELADILDTSLKPLGVGVYVIGSHGCMTSRGVEQEEASIATTQLVGNFREAGVKKEFYDIVKRRPV